MTLSRRLLMLMLAVLLPAAALLAWIIAATYQREVESERQHVHETVRALALVVDREFDKRAAVARTLAVSPALAHGHWSAFYDEARAATSGSGNWVMLIQGERQLFNTTAPLGAELPRCPVQPSGPLAPGAVEVSNMRVGAMAGVPVVAAFASIERPGPPMDIGVAFTPSAVQSILTEQRLPEGWVAAIFDRQYHVVARAPHPERYVGHAAAGDLATAMRQSVEGSIESVTLDGSRVRAYFSHSPEYGWGIAIGVPQTLLTAAALHAAMQAAGAALLLAVFALLLANWSGQRIRRPILALERAARDLAQDQVPAFTPTGLDEADAVGSALHRAGLQAMRLNDKLRREEEAQRLLLALQDAIRGEHDAARVQWEIVSRVGRYFGASRCAYGEVDFGAGTLRIQRDYTDGVCSIAGTGALNACPLALREASEPGRTIAVEDVRHDPRTEDPVVREHFEAMEVRAMVCVPLTHEGQLVALLLLHDRTPRAWSADDVALLEQVAHRTHFATVNARAESELRESRQVLQRLNAELAEADQRKDEFLATLAHELRNPLAPIANALEIMRRKDLGDPALRWTRDVIERQMRQMTRLVDDLLDVARITRGRIELRRERLDLAGIVQGAVEAARPLIDAGGHTLQATLPDTPLWVDGDPTRLTQVLLNLLNNAAKYTPSGGRIAIEAGAEGGQARISVRDNGIGLAPEHLAQVFEMFSQVQPAIERSQGGLGIGLALARGLVELHGGRIEAHSAGINRGAEFVVRVPLATPAFAPAAADSHSEAAADACRVLVVDDNRDAADSLAMVLELAGHKVAVANDGASALALAETFRPALALLDIGMPGMNGYELARALRQRPWAEGLVLVALTGWGQQDDKRRAHDAGFDHHLTKPVATADLDRIIRTMNADAPQAAS